MKETRTEADKKTQGTPDIVPMPFTLTIELQAGTKFRSRVGLKSLDAARRDLGNNITKATKMTNTVVLRGDESKFIDIDMKPGGGNTVFITVVLDEKAARKFEKVFDETDTVFITINDTLDNFIIGEFYENHPTAPDTADVYNVLALNKLVAAAKKNNAPN